MLRMTHSVRRRFALRSAVAMALALAGTGFAGAAAPAQAQEQPQYKPSREFNQVYQPVAAIANAATGDFAAARTQLPGVHAAIANEDDRFLAGSVTYLLGVKLKDRPLQRQGMEFMLASGKATPTQTAEINYFLGELTYDAQEWAKARGHLQAAMAGGYAEGNPEGLIAESYFKEGQAAQGLAFLEGLVERRVAAGQQVPESWLRRALQVALTGNMAEEAGKWSTLLVAHSPSERNWRDALAVVGETGAPTPSIQLDLLRLMAVTNTLSDRQAYERYIAVADPRVMANEVSRVLDAGVRAGVIAEGDQFYVDTKRIVDERMAEERSEAARYRAEAAAASDGRPARNAGDLFLALQSYAEAEEMFKLAVEKGGIDRDEALTRLGIAQVGQNKLAEARATFAQVSGNRTAVARIWAAYAESRA